MTRGGPYHVAADLVLVLHVAFVLFLIGGLVLIIIGGFGSWTWIRNPWFRISHLAGIGLVAIQACLGMVCPLTTLEMNLRERAGDDTYSGTFMAHWLDKFLYYDAPPWIFITAYIFFGLVVMGAWLIFRPRPFRKQASAITAPEAK